MIKPDTLWAFMKNTESDLLVGRICRSIGGQKVEPPLSDIENTILKLIMQSDEWHTEAVERDLARRRAKYAERKGVGVAKSPQISTEKTEKTESPESSSIHPSVHPSVHPVEKKNSKEESVLTLVADEPKKPVSKPVEERYIIPPTEEMVRSYCASRGNKVDPARFFNYWTSRGWEMRPKQKMKDWQAAVRSFELNGFDSPKTSVASKHPEGWRKPEKGQSDGLAGV